MMSANLYDPILVTKADGTQEYFDPAKLADSLKRANAKQRDIDYIVDHIQAELHNGDETAKIYRHAFAILKKRERPVAARYSLKHAISELGPSGYPFEVFISELFKAQGYETEVGIMMKGGCVEYEIDIVASNNDELLVGEAKFHNKHGIKSDLKVALYVHARHLDLEKSRFDGRLREGQKCLCMLITNTKFTHNAIAYGKCVGLKMIGWNYPRQGNLQQLVADAQLEPLTALTTLSKQEKLDLLNEGIVLSRTLYNNKAILRNVGISERRARAILEEVNSLYEKS